MLVTLIRTDFKPRLTFGLIDVDGQFICHSLEDTDRQLETNPIGKVYGETCIPRGKYPMVLDFSERFKQVLPHVLGVPCFDGIRIHPGNTERDTLGCILTGTARLPDGLAESRKAFDKLFTLLKSAKGKITLEVK